MGDWEYGVKNGLWGEDGMPYCLDSGGVRENRKHIYPEKTEINDKVTHDLAIKLIETKQKIYELEKLEKEIKNELMGAMKQAQWIKISSDDLKSNSDWLVKSGRYKKPMRINRKDLCIALTKEISREFANKILTECTTVSYRKTSIYVREEQNTGK